MQNPLWRLRLMWRSVFGTGRPAFVVRVGVLRVGVL